MVDRERLLLFKLLFERQVGDYASLSGMFGIGGRSSNFDHGIYQSRRMSREVLPDFCVNCLHDFGVTISGRARKGCPYCGGIEEVGNKLNHRMSAWTILTQDPTDYLLCIAFKEARCG